jgi:hypothetical protein
MEKKIRNDIILLAAIIVAVVIGFIILRLSDKGKYVSVSVKGTETLCLSLNTDAEKSINGTNTLVIKDGQAFIKEATCPDKICVEHKKISRTGESIICLPNEVVVRITSEDNGLDATL